MCQILFFEMGYMLPVKPDTFFEFRDQLRFRLVYKNISYHIQNLKSCLTFEWTNIFKTPSIQEIVSYIFSIVSSI